MIKTVTRFFLNTFSFLQILRYILIGGLAAFCQYAILTLSVEFFYMDPLIANVIGYGCGFWISLIGHNFWTFSISQQTFAQIVRPYLLTTLINFSLNISLFYCLNKLLFVQYQLAMVIDLAIVTCITFLFSKFYVFRS